MELLVKDVKKGDVFLCNLGRGVGSEQRKVRPVVVLQNDIGNKYSPTTIVGLITSKQKTDRNGKQFKMHVNVGKGEGNLNQDSVVLLEQMYTVDKQRFIRHMGTFRHNHELMDAITEAVKVSLGI